MKEKPFGPWPSLPSAVFLRGKSGVCPSLSEVEDVPLKALCKTRILLVGFGYNETNFGKLTEINGVLMGGKRPLPGQRSTIGP